MCGDAKLRSNNDRLAARSGRSSPNPAVRRDTLAVRALDPALRKQYSICNQLFRIEIAPSEIPVKLTRRPAILGSRTLTRLRNRRLALLLT